MKEFGRTGRNWLSLLPHQQWGRQGLWKLEECRSLFDNRKLSIVHAVL